MNIFICKFLSTFPLFLSQVKTPVELQGQIAFPKVVLIYVFHNRISVLSSQSLPLILIFNFWYFFGKKNFIVFNLHFKE